MSTVDLGNEQEMLPVTSKYVELLVLLSSEPQDSPDLKKAFLLKVGSHKKLN
jgi:hypothetical protein